MVIFLLFSLCFIKKKKDLAGLEGGPEKRRDVSVSAVTETDRLPSRGV